jgi:selenocysteine lyase/cysteine desulfurase
MALPDDLSAGQCTGQVLVSNRSGRAYRVGCSEYAEQAVRVGFIHHNTADEVDRLLDELARLVPASA